MEYVEVNDVFSKSMGNGSKRLNINGENKIYLGVYLVKNFFEDGLIECIREDKYNRNICIYLFMF